MPGPSSSASPPNPPQNAPTGPKAYRAAQAMTMTSQSRLRPNPITWPRVPSPSVPRHSSSPLVHSPLQQSFPTDADTTSSARNTPERDQETPSRRPRLTEPNTRPRGESRSSSVPIIRTPHDSDERQDDEGRTLGPHGGSTSRAASPMSLPGDSNNSHNRRSVKHLTCFWWWEKGDCKYSDEECLYAHEDTGHYTAAPRQVVPGEPAKAGKSLERALTKMAITNRSSASLASLGATSATVNHNTATAPVDRDSLTMGTIAASRPDTPFHARSHPTTPSPRASVDLGLIAHLRNDNDFLRALVEQIQQEKHQYMDTIESLHNELAKLSNHVNAARDENLALQQERAALQAAVRRMQYPNGVNSYQQGQAIAAPVRSPNTTNYPSQNPWGVIGSGSRTNGVVRPHTPVNRLANTAASQPRNFTFAGLSIAESNGSSSTAVSGNVNSSTYSASNHNATSYGSALRLDDEQENDSSHGGVQLEANGADGQRIQDVLRHLGPSF